MQGLSAQLQNNYSQNGLVLGQIQFVQNQLDELYNGQTSLQSQLNDMQSGSNGSSTPLTNYYTKSDIDNLFKSYFTSSQTTSAINNGISNQHLPDFSSYSTTASITKMISDAISNIKMPDLTSYATQAWTTSQIGNIPTTDLSSYATQAWTTTQIGNIPGVDLSAYATQAWTTAQIGNVPGVDLSAYATQAWTTTQIGNIPGVNLSAYATQAWTTTQIGNIPGVNLSAYATQAWTTTQIGNALVGPDPNNPYYFNASQTSAAITKAVGLIPSDSDNYITAQYLTDNKYLTLSAANNNYAPAVPDAVAGSVYVTNLNIASWAGSVGLATESWVNGQGFGTGSGGVTETWVNNNFAPKLSAGSAYITTDNIVGQAGAIGLITEETADGRYLMLPASTDSYLLTSTANTNFLSYAVVNGAWGTDSEFLTMGAMKAYLSAEISNSEIATPAWVNLQLENYTTTVSLSTYYMLKPFATDPYMLHSDIIALVTSGGLLSQATGDSRYVQTVVTPSVPPGGFLINLEGDPIVPAPTYGLTSDNFQTYLDLVYLQLSNVTTTLSPYALTTQIPSLSDYYTKEISDLRYASASISSPNLSTYALKSDLPNMALYQTIATMPSLSQYALSSQIPSLTDYYTKELADLRYAPISVVSPDLSGYALKTQLPNMSLYQTISSMPSLAGYALTSNLPNMALYQTIAAMPSLAGYALTSVLPNMALYQTVEAMSAYETTANLNTLLTTNYYTINQSDLVYAQVLSLPNMSQYTDTYTLGQTYQKISAMPNMNLYLTTANALSNYQTISGMQYYQQISAMGVYQTTTQSDLKYATIANIPNMSNYYTQSQADAKYATITALPNMNLYQPVSSMSSYATKALSDTYYLNADALSPYYTAAYCDLTYQTIAGMQNYQVMLPMDNYSTNAQNDLKYIKISSIPQSCATLAAYDTNFVQPLWTHLGTFWTQNFAGATYDTIAALMTKLATLTIDFWQPAATNINMNGFAILGVETNSAALTTAAPGEWHAANQNQVIQAFNGYQQTQYAWIFCGDPGKQTAAIGGGTWYLPSQYTIPIASVNTVSTMSTIYFGGGFITSVTCRQVTQPTANEATIFTVTYPQLTSTQYFIPFLQLEDQKYSTTDSVYSSEYNTPVIVQSSVVPGSNTFQFMISDQMDGTSYNLACKCHIVLLRVSH